MPAMERNHFRHRHIISVLTGVSLGYILGGYSQEPHCSTTFSGPGIYDRVHEEVKASERVFGSDGGERSITARKRNHTLTMAESRERLGRALTALWDFHQDGKQFS